MITSKLTGPVEPADRRVGRREALWVFGVAFLTCAVADLILEAVGWNRTAGIFRALALPLLIGALFAARPAVTRTVVLLVAGLVFSWLGDTIGELGFLVKIGLFLVAQWFFIAAFWPYRLTSLVRKPIAVLGYATLLAVLIAVLIRPAGDLAVPVLVYGASLVTMAILASGLNRWGTFGGLSFLVSDALLGINRFYNLRTPDLMDFLIMLSYLLAEAMLVGAVVAATPSGDRLGRGRGEPISRGG